MGKFTTTNQPNYKTRPKRGKSKKTLIKETIKQINGGKLGIDIIKVKKQILGTILSKDVQTLKELELVNTVVSELLLYDNTSNDKTIINNIQTSKTTKQLVDEFII